MAGEFSAQTWPRVTSGTLYWFVRNLATGQIWNTVAVALQAYATANIADYDLAATQQGTASGSWLGDMPAAPAGDYAFTLFKQAGGAPAEGDQVLATSGQLRWSGSAIVASNDANVTQWLGTAVSTPTVAGVPNVNVKTWNDLTTVALPLVPTTAGRTLDVSAGGEAGLDWANVGTPGSTVNLSATTVNLVNTVTTLTNLPAITANWLTAAGIAADAITAAKIADGALDAATFASGALDAVWSTATRTLTAGTNIQLPSNGLANITAWTVAITGTITGNVTGDVQGKVLGGGAGVITATGAWALNAAGAALATSAQATTLQADTDDIQTRLPAALVSGKMDVSVGAYASGQDPFTLVMATAMTESYSTGTMTVPQALYEIAQVVGQFSITGTTLTVQKRNTSTTAATFTLDDNTAPSLRTRAT